MRYLPGVLEDLVELLLYPLGEHYVARLRPAHAQAGDAVDGVAEKRKHGEDGVHECIQEHQQEGGRTALTS